MFVVLVEMEYLWWLALNLEMGKRATRMRRDDYFSAREPHEPLAVGQGPGSPVSQAAVDRTKIVEVLGRFACDEGTSLAGKSLDRFRGSLARLFTVSRRSVLLALAFGGGLPIRLELNSNSLSRRSRFVVLAGISPKF